MSPAGNLTAQGDLLFTDIDLSDTHTVSTTVSASVSGGGSIPLSNAALLSAFMTSLTHDFTGHLVGDIDWNFALAEQRGQFPRPGPDPDVDLSRRRHRPVASPPPSQDVTITILGTNHPVVITSGPEFRRSRGA